MAGYLDEWIILGLDTALVLSEWAVGGSSVTPWLLTVRVSALD